jgi:hypothetical protein
MLRLQVVVEGRCAQVQVAKVTLYSTACPFFCQFRPLLLPTVRPGREVCSYLPRNKDHALCFGGIRTQAHPLEQADQRVNSHLMTFGASVC